MATVETELVEEISSELLLAKAENTHLRQIIDGKDAVIDQLVQAINSKQTRIRAQRLINRKLFDENKESQEKLGEETR